MEAVATSVTTEISEQRGTLYEHSIQTSGCFLSDEVPAASLDFIQTLIQVPFMLFSNLLDTIPATKSASQSTA
jgi:hypothetical protein